jgi:hypothetical protein
VLLLAAAVVVAACGESEEDEALADVCDASASIQSHIEDLEGLGITAATDSESSEAAEMRSTLDAIGFDLGEITDASDELAEDTRQQVEAATDDFLPRYDTAVVQSVEENEYGRLVAPLARAYEQTLAGIPCD